MLLQEAMRPSYLAPLASVRLRFLNSLARRGLIEHDLAASDASLKVNLPKDGCAPPIVGSADVEALDQFFGGIGIKEIV